jgi:hypothetical protein
MISSSYRWNLIGGRHCHGMRAIAVKCAQVYGQQLGTDHVGSCALEANSTYGKISVDASRIWRACF